MGLRPLNFFDNAKEVYAIRINGEVGEPEDVDSVKGFLSACLLFLLFVPCAVSGALVSSEINNNYHGYSFVVLTCSFVVGNQKLNIKYYSYY